jgi:hypothetical protein
MALAPRDISESRLVANLESGRVFYIETWQALYLGCDQSHSQIMDLNLEMHRPQEGLSNDLRELDMNKTRKKKKKAVNRVVNF